MKKITGLGAKEVDARGLSHYERLDASSGVVTSLRPEYVTMSRRPGIAKSWFDKFSSDVYPNDCVVLRSRGRMPPPRYYDGLYELNNSLDMKRIKCDRVARCFKQEKVWNKFLQKYQMLDADRDERSPVKEEVKLSQIRLLSRSLEVSSDY